MAYLKCCVLFIILCLPLLQFLRNPRNLLQIISFLLRPEVTLNGLDLAVPLFAFFFDGVVEALINSREFGDKVQFDIFKCRGEILGHPCYD